MSGDPFGTKPEDPFEAVRQIEEKSTRSTSFMAETINHRVTLILVFFLLTGVTLANIIAGTQNGLIKTNDHQFVFVLLVSMGWSLWFMLFLGYIARAANWARGGK